MAVDNNNNIYFLNEYGFINSIRKVSSDGTITTVYNGGASAMQTDASGDLFFAANGYINKRTPNGNVTIIAGTGTIGYSGDSGLATNAQIGNIISMAVSSSGMCIFQIQPIVV